MLLIVTLRGEPGLADEPQHELMGQITTGLLEAMQIPWEYFPDQPGAVAAALDRAVEYMDREQRPYCLFMRKGTVAPHPLLDTDPPQAATSKPGLRISDGGTRRVTRADALRLQRRVRQTVGGPQQIDAREMNHRNAVGKKPTHDGWGTECSRGHRTRQTRIKVMIDAVRAGSRRAAAHIDQRTDRLVCALAIDGQPLGDRSLKVFRCQQGNARPLDTLPEQGNTRRRQAHPSILLGAESSSRRFDTEYPGMSTHAMPGIFAPHWDAAPEAMMTASSSNTSIALYTARFSAGKEPDTATAILSPGDTPASASRRTTTAAQFGLIVARFATR